MVTNTLAYLSEALMTKKKSFIMLPQVYQIAFSNDTSLKGYVHFTLSSEYAGATTFSITTLSKRDLTVTLNINDTRHNTMSERLTFLELSYIQISELKYQDESWERSFSSDPKHPR